MYVCICACIYISITDEICSNTFVNHLKTTVGAEKNWRRGIYIFRLQTAILFSRYRAERRECYLCSTLYKEKGNMGREPSPLPR